VTRRQLSKTAAPESSTSTRRRQTERGSSPVQNKRREMTDRGSRFSSVLAQRALRKSNCRRVAFSADVNRNSLSPLYEGCNKHPSLQHQQNCINSSSSSSSRNKRTTDCTKNKNAAALCFCDWCLALVSGFRPPRSCPPRLWPRPHLGCAPPPPAPEPQPAFCGALAAPPVHAAVATTSCLGGGTLFWGDKRFPAFCPVLRTTAKNKRLCHQQLEF